MVNTIRKMIEYFFDEYFCGTEYGPWCFQDKNKFSPTLTTDNGFQLHSTRSCDTVYTFSRNCINSLITTQLKSEIMFMKHANGGNGWNDPEMTFRPLNWPLLNHREILNKTLLIFLNTFFVSFQWKNEFSSSRMLGL